MSNTEGYPGGYAISSTGGGSLKVQEADGSPSVSNVTQINFNQANGFSVTDLGGGIAQIGVSAGSALTVQEADGSPAVANTVQINFNQANGFSVTDLGGGVAQVGLSGTTSPGGNSGDIQYNNGAGAFGGSDNAKIDSSTGGVLLVAQAVPSAPASTNSIYTVRALAAKNHLATVNSDGVIQFNFNGFMARAPLVCGVASSNTAPTSLGGNTTTSGTLTAPFAAGSANRWTSQNRKRYATTSSAGTSAGIRAPMLTLFSGNAAGYGGLFFYTRTGHSTNTTGYQLFSGICGTTSVLAGDPSALVNMVGIGYDSADTSGGNWILFHNDGAGTATRVDLGATNAARAADQGFDLYIYNPPNSVVWNVQVINVNTGVEVINTSYNSDVPAVNTGLGWKVECSNGAIAAAATVEHCSIYIESLGW